MGKCPFFELLEKRATPQKARRAFKKNENNRRQLLPKTLVKAKVRRRNQKGGKILIIDFSKINVTNMSTEFQILNMLLTLKEQENLLELPLSFIESELKISHNTLKKFLRVLRDGNVLKFSLKGVFTLNPDVVDFTDVCVPSAINILKYNYKMFQSD